MVTFVAPYLDMAVLTEESMFVAELKRSIQDICATMQERNTYSE